MRVLYIDIDSLRPDHSRGKLHPYLKRLRDTGRSHLADRLIERHMSNEKVN